MNKYLIAVTIACLCRCAMAGYFTTGGVIVADSLIPGANTLTNGGATINGSPVTNGASFTITGGGGGGGLSNIVVAGVTGTLSGTGSNVVASVSLASLAGAGVVTGAVFAAQAGISGPVNGLLSFGTNGLGGGTAGPAGPAGTNGATGSITNIAETAGTYDNASPINITFTNWNQAYGVTLTSTAAVTIALGASGAGVENWMNLTISATGSPPFAWPAKMWHFANGTGSSNAPAAGKYGRVEIVTNSMAFFSCQAWTNVPMGGR
jgi:hypothetical protein